MTFHYNEDSPLFLAQNHFTQFKHFLMLLKPCFSLHSIY